MPEKIACTQNKGENIAFQLTQRRYRGFTLRHPKEKINHLGFTLIELLVVIVIMGLLMSLVAPSMFSKVDTTKVKTAIAQMQMINTALDTYRLDLGQYPENLRELINSSSDRWDGPYLPKNIPEDPWGNPYQYQIDDNNPLVFKLMSLGADGKEGGEGQNKDIIHE